MLADFFSTCTLTTKLTKDVFDIFIFSIEVLAWHLISCQSMININIKSICWANEDKYFKIKSAKFHMIWASAWQNLQTYKTYNKTCVTSEDSDQPAHLLSDQSSLISCAFYSPRINKNPCHSTWMYRLIWVFAGHTGPEILNFFMLNLAEHENFSANKYENANNSWHFHIYQQRNSHAHLPWYV